ncbi:hypothetical protein CBE01nite_35410 [Clostridium beijerinckii]|uniref:Uncharacterized protein n=1 Tax=Clostridium beijerinckii TaxID=1520 RepID=A0AB74VHT6_CLOBE|nr:hypothetical protein [Clostridium beijerinckii]NRZ25151.1 ribosomal protein L7/L12 [Clostridium beijerinckii]NYB99865.1 ribosomal protein L7/L12 [Clostridium beijerinckii]OOM26484.1 hypothetical protein CLBEI_10780 [Clostridium beijerinckii]QUN35939.1 hypothetical protein KEC93_03665 [Clostridium beijerinckii]SQB13378.1 Uncharacterised protein [Clostridium beijerinckii]
MEKYKVLKLDKESLENSIAGLSQIKPVLQNQCLAVNLDGKGKEDAKELGEHFETAINAMITVLGLMEGKKISCGDVPEDIKEEILKEYAEDLYEEFMQIDRFEKGITLKDVADILQIESV